MYEYMSILDHGLGRALSGFFITNQPNMRASVIHQKFLGFTLLELLVVLLIAIILQFLAVPAFHSFLTISRMGVVSNRLLMAIRVSRMEAIERHQVVRLCGASDGKTCDGSWNKGQIIVLLSSGKVLRRYSGLSHGDYLLWKGALGRDDYINFNGQGFVETQGTFHLCPKYFPGFGRELVISLSGCVREIRVRCDKLV